jgi:uncharacterized protein YraI
MKLRFAVAVAAALWLAWIPPAAQAQPTAYAAKDVHLRAGPARDYPVVVVLPAGTPLEVMGCLPDYSWCDVIAYSYRGWVYAGNIAYMYQNAPVLVFDYGPLLGIGVITFFLGDYWDHYYRHYPWYRDRDEWIHRPRPPQPPLPIRPRPPIVVPPPPHPVPPVRPPAPPRGERPGPPRGEPPHRPPPPPRGGEPPRPPPRGGEPPRPPPRGGEPPRPPPRGGEPPRPPPRGTERHVPPPQTGEQQSPRTAK